MPLFLLTFFTSKNGILITLAVIAFTTIFGYYYWSQKELTTLRANNGIMKTELDKQLVVIQTMEKDIKKVTQEKLKYAAKTGELAEKTRKLEIELSEKFSLTEELKTKTPKEVETKLNKTLDEIFSCFEKITNGEECTQ